MDLIALQQALQVRFRESLLHDLLTTLVLIQPARHLEGVSDWVQPVADRLLAAPPEHFLETTSALVFVPGIHGWLMHQIGDHHPAHENFDALQTAFPPAAEWEAPLLEALQNRARGCEVPVTDNLITMLEGIQHYREQLNAPPLPMPYDQLADWLSSPALFREGLLNSLQALWTAGYADHYATERQRWHNAVHYHQSRHQQGDFAAIFRAVTGRPIPKKIEAAAEAARVVEWFPSCHVGTYAVYNTYQDTLRVSFNANLAPTNQGIPADLTGLYPVFKALADETRLQILGLLANGQEYSVGDLAELLRLSVSNISRHLTLMGQTDLVQVRPHGTTRYYRLNPAGFGEVIKTLQLFQEQ